MLGVDANQVAGDGLTGIYRAKGPLPYRNLNADQAVEAYSWGALTSGVQGFLGWVRRVLWLTLLPFAFVNVAYWARFHLDTSSETTGREARISARCIRWAGLLLTCLFVLTPCLIFIDLIGWQCYGGNANGCPRLPDQIDFMTRFNAAQRMAIASVGPFAVLATLWGLSRSTRAKYEAVRDTDKISDMGPSQPLRSRHMWSGELRCRRLQHLHVGMGIATIVTFSGLQMLMTSPNTVGLLWATTGLAIGVWGYAFGRAWILEDHVSPWDEWVPRAALIIAVLHLLALWFVPLTDAQDDADFGGPFKNNNLWFLVVIVGLLALNTILFLSRCSNAWVVRTVIFVVIVLPFGLLVKYPHGVPTPVLWVEVAGGVVLWLGMIWWHFRFTDDKTSRHESAAWRGAAPAVLLGAGAWVALLFSSAAVIGAADYLNGSEHPVSQLDTVVDKIKVPDVDDEITVRGDVVIAGAVLLPPTAGSEGVRILGGTLRADSASSPGVVNSDLFDHTILPAGTIISLGAPGLDGEPIPQSILMIDSCVRSDNGDDPDVEDPCRASSRGFQAQASYAPQSLRLTVSERPVTLKFDAPPQRPLIVPQVLTWTPMVQLAWLLVVAVLLGVAVAFYWGTAGKLIRHHEFSTDKGTPVGSLSDVRKHRVTAALAHRAEALTDIVGGVTTLLGLLLLVGASSGMAPWALLPWTRQFSTAALYAAVGSALLLVFLGSYIRRSESTRKAVGILWDLSTFWPRAAHPLAPPCYAERVVPELTTRIRWALDRGALVVFSGHSQGSLIAVAVASRLEDSELARVRMITYGSQVRALYGRVFPAVFGPQFLGNQPTKFAPSLRDSFPDCPPATAEVTPYFASPADTLRARIGPDNWINLFRRTDPLGYRVFTDYDSAYDRPVREVPVEGIGDPGPRIGGHSGYQHTPEYRAAVGAWLEETPVDIPSGVAHVEPLPIL